MKENAAAMKGNCVRPARLDVALVEAGLFGSRQRAQTAISAGTVRVNGVPGGKPSGRVEAGALLEAEDPLPYVGRGGRKLEAALDHFGVAVAGRVALDVGASTGGFTDCLLQRGARLVHAVDVGTGQLAPTLRSDPRVRNLENTDIRRLPPGALSPAPDLAVVDVSFISLRLILPHLLPHLALSAKAPARARAVHAADIILLVKPQFEVGPERVGKGGIVRREADRLAAVTAVQQAAASLGLAPAGTAILSPVPGGDGNIEYLTGWTYGSAARRDTPAGTGAKPGE
ncbi:MAG: TlyA family RNA methyltransferase [Symbiobacteriia bacterium]